MRSKEQQIGEGLLAFQAGQRLQISETTDDTRPTQRFLIEVALRANKIHDAQAELSNWGWGLSKKPPQEDAFSEQVEFEETLGLFLANFKNRPTDVFLTPKIADFISDPFLKAAYLHRQLGGRFYDEGRWDEMPAHEYFQPGLKESEWLSQKRLELADYPVTEVIDAVLARSPIAIHEYQAIALAGVGEHVHNVT